MRLIIVIAILVAASSYCQAQHLPDKHIGNISYANDDKQVYAANIRVSVAGKKETGQLSRQTKLVREFKTSSAPSSDTFKIFIDRHHDLKIIVLKEAAYIP